MHKLLQYGIMNKNFFGNVFMSKFYFENARDLDETFVVSEPNPYNTCEPHFHRQFEILYVIKGENEVIINSSKRTVCAGEIAFADSYDVHAFQSKDDCMSVSIIFPYDVMHNFIKQRGTNRFAQNFIPQNEAIKFIPLLNMMQQYKNIHDLLLNALAESFLGLLLRTYPLIPAKNKQSALIYKILNYLEDNFRTNITLETTASHFGYNKFYFSKLFHFYFHCNFNTYLNSLRVRNARRLIEQDGMSVLNAALDSGFNSMPTFYRAYKKHYGVPEVQK